MSPPSRVEHPTSYGARFIQLRARFGRAFLSLLDPCILEIHFQKISSAAHSKTMSTFTNHHTLFMKCDLLQCDKIHEYIRLFPALELDHHVAGILSDPTQLNTHPPNHQRPSGLAAAVEDEYAAKEDLEGNASSAAGERGMQLADRINREIAV
ncbi:hypothetical protein C8R44DRAFT_725055 [Mycena epipterygia]|nr:hypothetical protein C8R44DRAFT_725055 [Mycena epipterygia]